MKRKFFVSLLLLLLLTLFITACGGTNGNDMNDMGDTGGDTSGDTSGDAMPKEVTLVIGYTQSLSGKYETSSGKQFNAFKLWLEDVNEAGGVVLSDGTVVKFDTVSYDDESSTDRVQELYTRLATEDNADMLISPYSSGLTKVAAPIAEQYGKVLIAVGAASDSIFQQGYTQIYQIYTPASRYLVGAVDLLQATDPDVKKVSIVYENDQFAIDVATVAKSYAESLGFEIVQFEGYDSDTADFGPFINKIEESGAEAIIGGGHLQDGSTFARQLYEKGTDLKFFALVVAPPEPEFGELGDAALGVVGPTHWEPLANITEESSAGFTWLGPDGSDFVADYQAAYEADPSYHAAGGYAAGLVLQQAIIEADSTDPAAISAAMENLDLMTFWGYVKFDTTAESHGLQLGHSSMYIQWQLDGDTLVKQVVWPLGGATADLLFPIR